MKTADFQKTVLTWYDQQGRKDLPWQQNKTPYRVWLSEIMLQQTQVATVIPYFNKFIEALPSIKALAAAKTDEVLHLWTGLGYYSRARNLHKAAQIIMQEFSGKFPDNLHDLQNLPGIGRSTAGAILALAFNKHATILDGNVKRVLTRFYAIEGWPANPKVEKTLWEYAEKLTPTKRIADYTQVMMDLGATLCTRSKPNCAQCPLQKNCMAYQQNRVVELPHKKPRKALPIKNTFMLLLKNKQKILLEKRPPVGIWGGLWSLPEQNNVNDIKEICQKNYACEVLDVIALQSFRHTFSHFHLDITPLLIEVSINTRQAMDSSQFIWYNNKDSQSIGLPQPVKKLLEIIERDSPPPGN